MFIQFAVRCIYNFAFYNSQYIRRPFSHPDSWQNLFCIFEILFSLMHIKLLQVIKIGIYLTISELNNFSQVC